MVKRWRAGFFRGIVITAAIGLVIGVGAVISPSFDFANRYRGLHSDRVFTTELGEQQDIRLASGPHVVMNTQTALTARELPQETQLELRSGEIFVDAARKLSRPVRVIAGSVAV